jgi:hypothetical protein
MKTTEAEVLGAGDVQRLLLRVYKKYTAGEITEARADREASLLNSILKAIELKAKDKLALEPGDIKFKVEFK